MKSSINAESPIGGGVFQGTQPFMNETMQRKLDEEKQVRNTQHRIQSRQFDQNILAYQPSSKRSPIGR